MGAGARAGPAARGDPASGDRGGTTEGPRWGPSQRGPIRPLERQILRLLGVADFLSLRAADRPVAGASVEPAG